MESGIAIMVSAIAMTAIVGLRYLASSGAFALVTTRVRPGLYRGRPAFVDVECDSSLTLGHTIVDWQGRTGKTANATIMTAIDSDGFFALLTERLGRF